MRIMHILGCILAMVLLALPASAESSPSPPQQAENLDKLFGQLRDKDVGAESLRIERMIWQAWMNGGSEADNRVLQDAQAAMDRAEFQKCLDLLNQVLARTTDFPEAYNRRATLYFLMGRLDESLIDIVATLELEPRHFGALSGRGMIYQRLGKNSEALSAYREALSMNPHMLGPRLAVQQLEKLVPDL